MKGWFEHHDRADPVPLDDKLPGPARRLFLADRACCCPARPVVTVVIPAGRGRPCQADLLLCGHHYRVSRQALAAAGAAVRELPWIPDSAAAWICPDRHRSAA